MKKKLGRILAALGLLAAATVVPTAAWYAVGSREAAREAARTRARALTQTTETADRVAMVIRERLEAIRRAEEARPYFQYQNVYHDPRAQAVGASVQLSPLADNTLDPLIAGHFQIDGDGRVSMPTINPELPELNEDRPEHRVLLAALEHSSDSLRALSLGDRVVATHTTETIEIDRYYNENAAQSGSQSAATTLLAQNDPGNQANAYGNAEPQQQAPRQKVKKVKGNSSSYKYRPRNKAPQSRIAQVQSLDESEWNYNQAANEVYTEIQSSKNLPIQVQQAEVDRKVNPQMKQVRRVSTPRPTQTPRQLRKERRKSEVEIRVGGLDWYTVELGDALRLAALRHVSTPAGWITQGFVISDDAIGELIEGASVPANLVPDIRHEELAVSLGLPGVDWGLAIDPSLVTADANARAEIINARFQGTFAFGTGIAALAGIFLMLLFFKSEQLAQQRSRFAASAAHELRTPLAGIRMYGEMLAEGLGDPARAKDYARRVASEADRLARIVKNVLGFTRLEQGNLAVTAEAGDARAAVLETIDAHRGQLEAAGMTVVVDVPESLPRASFDRDAVAQILQNLLDNAEKYTRDSETRRVRVQARTANGRVVVSVTDWGPGVPRSVRRRVFRPFSRGGEKDAPPGLGLGLSLARALARAQGGDLAHRDNPEGGSVFELSLPTLESI